MVIDHPYQLIADALRLQIERGELAPGEKLPSEASLVERYSVARGTVRRAISELVAAGLVVSISGRGHIVRQSRPLLWVASTPERNSRVDITPADTWSRSVRDQGRTPSEKIRVEKALADDKVAHWFNLEPGDPVVIRRRLRFVDGEEYQIADSYYPLSIVAGTAIEMPGDVLPGIYAIFEELGCGWITTRDRVIARAPSREEAQLLHIPRGVQVAEVIRRSYDRSGRPVRLTFYVLPQDRHEIEIEYHYEEEV